MKHFSNAWGASRAPFILKHSKGNCLTVVLTPDTRQAELLVNELRFFSNKAAVYLFPEYRQEPFEEVRTAADITSARSLALKALLNGDCGILVSTPYALAKKTVPPDIFLDRLLVLEPGKVIAKEDLQLHLERLGYLQVEFVNGEGEYCFRGGLVDLFPVGMSTPVRLEYFDDELETLFTYSVDNQKSIASVNSIELLPAGEILFTTQELLDMELGEVIEQKLETFGKFAGHHWLTGLVYPDGAWLADYLPHNRELCLVGEDWTTILDRFFMSINDNAAETFFPSPEKAFVDKNRLLAFLSGADYTLTDISSLDAAEPTGYKSTGGRFAFDKNNVYQAGTAALQEIKKLHREGAATVIVAESERFVGILSDFGRDYELPVKEILSVAEAEKPGIIYIHKERMSAGFIDEGRFALITDEEIFGFSRRRTRAAQKKAFNTNISDLAEGDYVVHIDYGIGIYEGLKHKVIGGMEGDYLQIVYDNGELLLVPLEQISQIQKYIGIGDAKPRIASLQSTNWAKLKATARKHAAKIAQDLLKLYAERKARKGFSFKDSGQILPDFEERFQYDETEDQLSAIMDVYHDMDSDTPMDRLISGDVGFGKTEVAMRAAMKAAACGKQVAMLVPTTVLARQHYNTFKERFKNFPVNVDYISRFRTAEEIRKIRSELASGRLDILIGTHRILSKDMEFHDLHLLIIDEEQRFGVAHKEKIAAMRTNIDALSMSATPIPRTLQMSLSGIKDISTIETPPRDRQPVAVKVIGGQDDVKQAVTRELERGGQVFFLHNRINNISECAQMLKNLAPHARIAIAHGQTPTGELDRILSSFYEGEIDILVSTTIIENGIDIPNVNAIIIDNAANFGLSQLYQLKGRVGRSSRRGYCYLLVNNFASLTPIAKKRLSIVQQLSDLGSGLKIAMYDLQLRGAGDILGAAQSGFVVKVGYELFLKMISEAVATLQQIDEGVETEIITQFAHYISAEYIEDPHLRLDYYRRFSQSSDRLLMDEIFEELVAGYGELKAETLNLGYIMLIKNLAARMKIKKVGVYLKMLRLSFAENAVINPAVLMKIAGDMGLQYRFSGEYEFILSFGDESQTLTSGLLFLEKLSVNK